MRGTTLKQRIRQSNLGEMLRVYRMLHNRTLRNLAAEIGTSSATLMRIEHGQSFDADTLLKFWTWMLKPQKAAR